MLGCFLIYFLLLLAHARKLIVRKARVQFSYYINDRQPNGRLSNVLSRLAVGVRVDGDGETQRKEHEREGDQEESRRHATGC